MEARRVQITPITQQKLAGPLSLSERIALRRNKIIEYIKSKPLGTPIRVEEFALEAKLSKANAQIYITKMIEDGTIFREAITPKKFCFSVQDSQVKVIRTATMRWSAPELEDVAMRYVWSHAEQQNDLRNFIMWLKGEQAEKAQ